MEDIKHFFHYQETQVQEKKMFVFFWVNQYSFLT